MGWRINREVPPKQELSPPWHVHALDLGLESESGSSPTPFLLSDLGLFPSPGLGGDLGGPVQGEIVRLLVQNHEELRLTSVRIAVVKKTRGDRCRGCGGKEHGGSVDGCSPSGKQ